MTPLERLLAEELPTGDFGGPPQPRADRPPDEVPADPLAASHRAALLAALGAAPLGVRARTKPARHLRAVPPAA